MPEDGPDWEKVKQFLEPKPPLYCPHTPHPKQKAFLRSEAFEALFGGAASGGKLCDIRHTILTTTGWTTIGELRVGDFVFDEDGEPTEVLAKSEILYEDTYKLTLEGGEELVAGGRHRWNVASENQRGAYQRTNTHWKARRRAKRGSRGRSEVERELVGVLDGRARGTAEATAFHNSKRAQEARDSYQRPSIWDYTSTLTTEEVIELQRSERKRVCIPNGGSINGDWAWMSDVPAYTLGVWLGDGGSKDGLIYTAEEYKTDLEAELERDGWHCEVASLATPEQYPARTQNFYGLRLTNIYGETLKDILKREGLLGDKHIPDWTFLTSHTDRQALVSGFFDTDGYVDSVRGRMEMCLATEDMCCQLWSLMWSMGFKTSAVQFKKTINQDPEFEGKAWRFQVSQSSECFFRLPFKHERWKACDFKARLNRTEYRAIESIEEVESVPMQCIQVANPRGLFRVGRSFVVTHNSDALLMGALQYVDVPGYAAFIFRNTFADLALPGAIMDRARDWLSEHPEVRWLTKSSTAVFPSGATLSFGYLDGADDYLRYKGMEVQYIGFDEVTEIRENDYRYLLSRIRKPSVASGSPLAFVPLRARSASNPAPNWVRRYFVEEGRKNKRLFVPCGFEENPYIDQEAYGETLDRMSAVHRAQLKYGDWYAEESGAMFDRSDFDIISIEDVPDRAFMSCVRYWDLAATEKTQQNPDPDYTVGAKVAIVDGIMYILDVRRDRLNAAGVERLLRMTADEDGAHVKVRMDQDPGQAGKAQVSHLARHVMLGYDFDGNPVPRTSSANQTAKEGRLNNWSAKAKRGEIKLVRGEWVTAFLDEAVGFGSSTNLHDDQMDAVSGAFEVLTGIKGKNRRSVSIIV